MKKILMIFLLICFLAGLAIIFWFYKKRNLPAASLSLPVTEEITPSPFPPSPSPSPLPESEITNIENDLQLIEEDLKKMREDTRFNPPSFIFDLKL